MPIYDEIIKIIQQSPYKLTPQREKIVEILVENDEQHLSAEELYFILKEKTPDIGIATVYRTLDIFYELKILEKISFSNGVSKYHLRQSVDDELHHHLICTNCNNIEKVSNPIFNKLIEYMKKEYPNVFIIGKSKKGTTLENTVLEAKEVAKQILENIR